MKNTMDNIHIEDCSKLELHIHIIGHYPKGESILVILWDGNDNSVLQSILIDSYQTKKGNLTVRRVLVLIQVASLRSARQAHVRN
jgi:hypothetical protein